MAQVGVCSDIHGNLPALEAVWSRFTDADVKVTVCCGDLVGHVGWNEEVVTFVRENFDFVVFGNHDARIRDDFHYAPRSEAEKTEHKVVTDQLSVESVEYLCGLPDRIECLDMIVAHSWPKRCHEQNRSSHGFNIGDRGIHPKDAATCGPMIDGKMAFVGHTHHQWGQTLDKFEGISGTILNPGSVGCPWQGPAEYAIADPEDHTFTHDTVEFDDLRVGDRLYELGTKNIR